MAAGIGTMGMLVGVMSIPTADGNFTHPTTAFTGIAFGVGVTGYLAAGAMIWASSEASEPSVRVDAGPGALRVHGRF